MTLHEPAVRFDDASAKWVLLEALVVDALGFTLVVPAGFPTDGASSPRATWALGFAPWELGGLVPCVPHDWGYEHGGWMLVRTATGDVWRQFSKDWIDAFFLDLMRQQRVPEWKAVAAYEAVQTEGASSWQSAVFPPSPISMSVSMEPSSAVTSASSPTSVVAGAPASPAVALAPIPPTVAITIPGLPVNATPAEHASRLHLIMAAFEGGAMAAVHGVESVAVATGTVAAQHPEVVAALAPKASIYVTVFAALMQALASKGAAAPSA